MKIKLLIGTLFLSILLLAGCSTKERKATTYVGLRINPEVGFLVDSNGDVTDVIPQNLDGDVEGTDNEVFVEVIGEDEEVITYQEKLRNRINNFFINKGIKGKASEESREQYLEAAFELVLSVGHTKW